MNSTQLGRKLTALAAIMAVCVMVFAMPMQADENGRGARGGLVVPLPSGATASSSQLGIPAGTPLTGSFIIQRFVAQNGKLFAVGTLVGQAAGQDILVHGIMSETKATALPVQTSSTVAGAPEGFKLAQAASCNILNLNVNPLHLDLLGLVVDTQAITVNIVAQQGAGNLLGNLLCAITNALNTTGTNTVNQVAGMLNQAITAVGGAA